MVLLEVKISSNVIIALTNGLKKEANELITKPTIIIGYLAGKH
jgi:hypothetical protein